VWHIGWPTYVLGCVYKEREKEPVLPADACAMQFYHILMPFHCMKEASYHSFKLHHEAKCILNFKGR